MLACLSRPGILRHSREGGNPEVQGERHSGGSRNLEGR